MLLFRINIIIYLLLSSAFFNLKNEDASDIKWSANRKLKWEDYQAPIDNNSKYGAGSYITIESICEPEDTCIKIEITSCFHPQKSWVKHRDSIGLLHEQGHFDIYEIFARIIRKKMSEINHFDMNNEDDVNRVTQKFNSIIEEENRELRKTQSLYDGETNFSRNSVQQVNWLKRIELQLDSLKCFSNNLVILKGTGNG